MNFKTRHPRLLLSDLTWTELDVRRTRSATLDRLLKVFERDGRVLLELPPLTRQKIGRRLLAVSREALRRILLWSFDYRVTGDTAFLHRAEQEMLAMAAFIDWNPSHFLDTAEMTLAMALGYDWLFDALDPKSRAVIRHAIIEKGLRPGLDPAAKLNWWYDSDNNWNPVCLAGMTLGALAIAEDAPDLADQYIERVKTYNGRGLSQYAPDGVYIEGPAYWDYGTTFEVLLLAALESAVGTDFDLAQNPGFLATAEYPAQVTGPSGLFFNYSDGEEAAILQAALFWFARKLKRPGILHFQFDYLEAYLARKESDPSFTGGDRLLPLMAIWGEDLERKSATPAELAWFRGGKTPLAIFRSSWTERDALFLGIKGGLAGISHGHMDAGSFVLEVDGVRWAVDLDRQDYESLESKKINYWDASQQGDRWRVFRTNNFGHNTLTINGQLHRMEGRAEIIRFSGREDEGHAVLDLTPVFAGQAGQVTRGFKLLPRRQVLIQDEITGLQPGDTVRWTLVTRANITANGAQATLWQDGRTLHAGLAAPGFQFKVASAEPSDDFNAPNPGISLLIAHGRASGSGRLVMRVLLSPGAAPLALPPETPCESWSKPLST